MPCHPPNLVFKILMLLCSYWLALNFIGFTDPNVVSTVSKNVVDFL